MVEVRKIRDFLKKQGVWFNGLVLCLSPMVSFFIMEIIVGNYNLAMFRSYSTYNIVWYAVLYFMVFALIRKIKLTILISNIVIYLIAMVNYFVFTFKGNPILPSDLLAWKTGLSVANNYVLIFTKDFILATSLMFLLFVLASKLEEKKRRISIINRGIGIGAFLVFYAVIFHAFFQTNLIKSKISVLDFFAPKYTYSAYGTAFGFVANVHALKAEPPEGYSVNQIVETFSNIEEKKESVETLPNIIVIMNEAYSDLSFVGDYETNMEYRPYTKTLTDNTIHGNLFVSVFGGATSDTEYEVLTGNSMAVMPANCVPYQQFVTKPTDSLAFTLKAQGYYNIAIHPYNKSGYKRDVVYPLLGFDEFLSKDDFENPQLIRSYISDRDSYKKIIEEYETKGKENPLFIFNVTMQNHGGYSASKLFDEGNNVKLTNDLGHPEVEQYLSLLRETDKAFEVLVDYFSEQEEPTIILLYGDHQPIAYSDFYRNDPAGSINQNKYKVPFVIWANYDIPEENIDKMSANYLSSYLLEVAGVQSTEYNQYLLELYKELPVITGMFYIDKENRQYRMNETSEYSSHLIEYQSIGYNNVFDKDDRVEQLYELNN